MTEQCPQRLMHTMIRVGDLERSIRFYCDNFGMKLMRSVDVPAGEYTVAFVGYGNENDDPMIEFTYNYGKDRYELGTGYGHIAIGVSDVYAVCQRLRDASVKIAREPGPLKFGTIHIAFVDDPDGYRIELIDTRANPVPIA